MASLITNIAFIVITIIALAVMLKKDIQLAETLDFNAAKYYAKLVETDEMTTMKRLVLYAVLLGSVSSLGIESWYVMAILAIATLGIVVYMLRQPSETPYKLTGSAKSLYMTEFAVMLAIMLAVSFTGTVENGVRMALYAALAFTGFSYGFTYVACLLKALFGKSKKQEK